jgi:hypothetical protein
MDYVNVTADRALLNLFTDLHRANLADVASRLAELCDRIVDTGPATTGQHLAIVQMLRDAYPEHAHTIMNLSIGRLVA